MVLVVGSRPTLGADDSLYALLSHLDNNYHTYQVLMDIEIGITIVAKIYLHVLDNDMPTAFEVKRITEVNEEDTGTVITYAEQPINPLSSGPLNTVNYIVSESKEDIEKAIKDAEYYRDEGLKHISSLLG